MRDVADADKSLQGQLGFLGAESPGIRRAPSWSWTDRATAVGARREDVSPDFADIDQYPGLTSGRSTESEPFVHCL